ncbi:hypothetical protein PQX77_018740 [Marasmius sp. AFHP31]|nr:hypothetical protein PQX77_018740 [Marasmius sp. AFHP31]
MEEKEAEALLYQDDDGDVDVDSELEEYRFGLYRMFIENNTRSRAAATYYETPRYVRRQGTSVVLRRFFRDIIPIAAGPVGYSVMGHVVGGILPVVEGILESQILRILEDAISNRSLDSRNLVFAVVSRLFVRRAGSIIMGWCGARSEVLKERVRVYFDGIIFASKPTLLVHHTPDIQVLRGLRYPTYLLVGRLRMDLPTALQDRRDYDHGAYEAVGSTLSIITEFVHVVGRVGFLSSVGGLGIRHSTRLGITFSALCLVRPLLDVMPTFLPRMAFLSALGAGNWIWSTPRVIETVNEDLHRYFSFEELVETDYRMDVISGDLVEHVIDQRAKSARAAGDMVFGLRGAEDIFVKQYTGVGAGTVRNLQSIITALFEDCIEYMPMVYYALRVIQNPSEISLATITTLQTSMLSIRGTFSKFLKGVAELNRAAVELREIYDLEVVNNAVKDEGQLSFPGEKSSEEGMTLELRNVSFRYPGSQNIDGALDDVSFKIGAGELIVVVGANGSGKSTLVNILSRLYDATSGQVLLDGVDIKEYKLSDIRQAIAILTQDHQLFPGLSLKENIGLGDVRCAEDEVERRIAEGVRKGGAGNVIGKLERGVDTVLDSRVLRYSQLVDEGDETNPLVIKMEQLERTSNVSGGERQRLVASRTFMRMQSNRIKFVAVDEPTSALDPEGELALFTQLRGARKGKTMLFITHRFGPLTKHADNIICMKDGKIVELGNHASLMEMNGEYCKMYRIQADAFQS